MSRPTLVICAQDNIALIPSQLAEQGGTHGQVRALGAISDAGEPVRGGIELSGDKGRMDGESMGRLEGSG